MQEHALCRTGPTPAATLWELPYGQGTGATSHQQHGIVATLIKLSALLFTYLLCNFRSVCECWRPSLGRRRLPKLRSSSANLRFVDLPVAVVDNIWHVFYKMCLLVLLILTSEASA